MSPTRWTCILRSVLSVTAIFVVGCSQPKKEESCGFVQNVYGERVSWKGTSQVRLALHTSVSTEFEGALRRAAETWNLAIGRTLLVIDTHRVGGNAPGRDGVNVVYFMKAWESDKTSEQARTSLYWVGDQIHEADIRINGSNYTFSTSALVVGAVDMESLAIHELGHVLGLKHNDSLPSVMATYLRTNQERSQLQSSDQTSLSCEY